DPERVAVEPDEVAPARLAGVPGDLLEADALDHGPVAFDHHVGRRTGVAGMAKPLGRRPGGAAGREMNDRYFRSSAKRSAGIVRLDLFDRSFIQLQRAVVIDSPHRDNSPLRRFRMRLEVLFAWRVTERRGHRKRILAPLVEKAFAAGADRLECGDDRYRDTASCGP